MVFKLHFCHSASLHFMAKVQLKNHRLSQRYAELGCAELSIYIWKVENGARVKKFHLAKEQWELPELFKVFELWLNEVGASLEHGEWVADFGFSPRVGANGGGPIISTALMAKCLNIGISIYLSEYAE
jgi:hypothetical protein